MFQVLKRVMSCNKCRRTPALEGDTWCLGCAALESLNLELCSSWYSRALRGVANDLIVNTVTAVRALRQVSTGLQSAEHSRAASSAREGTRSPLRTTRSKPPLPAPPAPPPPSVPVKEQEESYESETEGSEDEEEATPGAAAKSKPVTRPVEAERHSHHGEEGRGSRKRKSKRGHRAGKKHPRLHRALENPDIELHRKLPASFWEQRSNEGRRALERRR